MNRELEFPGPVFTKAQVASCGQRCPAGAKLPQTAAWGRAAVPVCPARCLGQRAKLPLPRPRHWQLPLKCSQDSPPVVSLAVSPTKRYLQVPTPGGPVNVALPGSRAFADVTTMLACWVRVGPDPVTSVLIGSGQLGLTRGEGCVTAEDQAGGTHVQSTDGQGLPMTLTVGGNHRQVSPRGPQTGRGCLWH